MARKSTVSRSEQRHARRRARRRADGLDEVLAVPSVVDSDDPGVGDKASQILFDLIDQDRLTAEAVGQRISSTAVSEKLVAERLALALQRAQFLALDDFRRRLGVMSTSLTAEGCWSFLLSNLRRARAYAVEDEFRFLIFESAGQFASIRMLRSGHSHRRPAQQTPTKEQQSRCRKP